MKWGDAVMIRAGSKIFQKERIVLIETREVPRAVGWPEDVAASVLVDAGERGHWIQLSDSEWGDFQVSLGQQSQSEITTRNKWEHT